MADSILTNLVQQLGALALEEFKVLRGVGEELKALEKELRFMKKFLRNSEGLQEEHELVRELVEQIKEVAFEAEDVIESFLLNVGRQKQRTTFGRALHFPEQQVMLHGVAKQIEGIKRSIDDIYANKDKFGIEIGEGSMNPHFEATLHRRRKEVDEEMVGFHDAADTLLKQLVEGPSQLEILSIVGMGGLGKTTVAKRLYNDQIIGDHFRNRAWVSVSEDYDTRQLLVTLLTTLVPHKDELLKQETSEELKTMLRTHLLQKKFIIILDDVWQPGLWDDIWACFPDSNNGSRILITTRNTTVARYASRKEPHFLRFLEHNESWELFEKKVFRGDPCPTDLIPLGMEIVQRCKGLPLSIVVIASMLASKEVSERIWDMTLKDVSAHLGKDEACLEILALSYHSLPVELKPCFLYFAAFPEDYEMSVQRLLALWLAEGFIQPLGKLPLEEVAEGYLDALIDRSLVQAGTKRINGGLKTCRIHDLIRDLCIREAKTENFLLAASNINSVSSSTINSCKPRRLSVHRHTTRTVLSKDWSPSSIRAFLSFESQKTFASSAFWKKLYTEYKLLRVLDLGAAVKVETVPDDICNLANLRYLRLFLGANNISESVFKLPNLQMFFVEGTKSLNIPIGALLKLRGIQQLKFGESMTKLYGKSKALLPKKQLNNLQVLSSINPDQDFEDAIMNGLCPNLKKLSLSGSWSGQYSHGWLLINFLANLEYLQSLKICYYDSRDGLSNIFRGVNVEILPVNLTKITLKMCCWSQESLSMLGEFPNLRILKLQDMSKMYLTVREGLFPKLHTLHLDAIKGGDVRIPSPSEDMVPNVFCQLRSLLMKRCTGFWFHDYETRLLFKLPSLKDVQILLPDPNLVDLLEDLKRKNEIKYRLLIYRGD